VTATATTTTGAQLTAVYGFPDDDDAKGREEYGREEGYSTSTEDLRTATTADRACR
jgi:hypothetical protein